MKRDIKERARGQRAIDGAGVKLVRVLGPSNVKTWSPFLMMDAFDSYNPEDYRAGFPIHPHRGIETVSFISKGQMQHKDTLGNEDTITDGQVQWMTAGSGIQHEETLPASERLLGIQLWLNLPAKDKMTIPAYQSIKEPEIKTIRFEGGILRLLSGEYQNEKSFSGKYIPLDYYDIHMEKNASLSLEMPENKTVVIFTLLGDARVAGEFVEEKTAILTTKGTQIDLETEDEEAEILVMIADPIDEPIAWGGPIVMNTQQELQTAFDELRSGNFIKESMDYK